MAPTRPWLVVRFFRCRWIRPTGNCGARGENARNRTLAFGAKFEKVASFAYLKSGTGRARYGLGFRLSGVLASFASCLQSELKVTKSFKFVSSAAAISQRQKSQHKNRGYLPAGKSSVRQAGLGKFPRSPRLSRGGLPEQPAQRKIRGGCAIGIDFPKRHKFSAGKNELLFASSSKQTQAAAGSHPSRRRRGVTFGGFPRAPEDNLKPHYFPTKNSPFLLINRCFNH